MVGIILTAAGVLGLVLTLVVLAPRRRRTVTETRRTHVAGLIVGSSTVTTEDVTGLQVP